jgi:hypothetical protein
VVLLWGGLMCLFMGHKEQVVVQMIFWLLLSRMVSCLWKETERIQSAASVPPLF